jgi:hypothetical protein
MRAYLQAADDACAVQALVVQAELVEEEELLVRQVTRDDAFAPEPVIAQRQARGAFGAVGGGWGCRG